MRTQSSRSIAQDLARQLQVTSYLDYREFLGDLYEGVKSEVHPYSYLMFAVDLGFSAINMIRLVIARQRLLSAKSALTIVKALDLRRNDRKYFLAMVDYLNARGGKHKSESFQKMVDAKQHSVASFRDRQFIDYYSAWHHAVVYEMLRLKDLPESSAAFAARLYPSLTPDKIRQSVALLESLGLVTVDAASGKVTRKSDAPMLMPSDATAGQLSISNYHQAMIDAAKDAVTSVPDDLLEVNALTVSLSIEGFQKLRDRMRQICAEVLAQEAQETKRDLVAQFNLQLFSLTKTDARGNKLQADDDEGKPAA